MGGTVGESFVGGEEAMRVELDSPDSGSGEGVFELDV